MDDCDTDPLNERIRDSDNEPPKRPTDCPTCQNKKHHRAAACDECLFLNRVIFQKWRREQGQMRGDDYPEELSDDEKDRLSRHVLP